MGNHHFQPNNASTNHDHLLRYFRQRQSARAGHDAFLIDLQAGEWRRFTARRNNNVLAAQCLLAAFQQIHFDFVLVDERASAFDVVDTVLLQQELDAFCQRLDRHILGLHHLSQVELHIANFNTALLRVVQDLVIEMRVVQQGL